MPLFRAAGPASRWVRNVAQVRAAQQPRGDLVAVVGGVGGAVLDGAVVVGEPDEPGVLHAVALLGGRRAAGPAAASVMSAGKSTSYAEATSRRSRSTVAGRPGGASRSGRSVGQRVLEIDAVEVGRAGRAAVCCRVRRCARGRPAPRADGRCASRAALRRPATIGRSRSSKDHAAPARPRPCRNRSRTGGPHRWRAGSPRPAACPASARSGRGAATALGLHSAAPSIAYSAVKLAPRTQRAGRLTAGSRVAPGEATIDAWRQQSPVGRGGGRAKSATSSSASCATSASSRASTRSTMPPGPGTCRAAAPRRAGTAGRPPAPGRASRCAGDPMGERRVIDAVRAAGRAARSTAWPASTRRPGSGCGRRVPGRRSRRRCRVEHRRRAVVVAEEPAPGQRGCRRSQPRSPVTEGAGAGVGERRDLDRLLVEAGRRSSRAAAADRRHREVAVAGLDAAGSPAAAGRVASHGRVAASAAGEQQCLGDGAVAVASGAVSGHGQPGRQRGRPDRLATASSSSRARPARRARPSSTSPAPSAANAIARGCGERAAPRCGSRRARGPASPASAHAPRRHPGPTERGPTSRRPTASSVHAPSAVHAVVTRAVGLTSADARSQVDVGASARSSAVGIRFAAHDHERRGRRRRRSSRARVAASRTARARTRPWPSVSASGGRKGRPAAGAPAALTPASRGR